MFLGKAVILGALCVCTGSWLPADGQQTYYPVPNPFQSSNTGYYAVKSLQTSVSATGQRNEFEVDEYFSLVDGLSFSLHRRSKKASDSFVLIGDSPSDKFYVITDPDNEDEARVDCQLDHQHRARHSFPWQYEYERTTSGRGYLKTEKSFVYGVGAVWLNAIKRKVQTRQVADDSPYPESNLWLMRERSLEVKLLFDKPSLPAGAKLGPLIAGSRLGSMQIRREGSIGQTDGATSASSLETDEVHVSNFEADLPSDHQRLRKFQFQLARCREQNRRHSVFPSLMKALSVSSQRLLGLEYLETKFGSLLAEQLANGRKPGDFDSKRKRRTWPSEMRTELISFHQEAQVKLYEGFPETEQQFEETYLKRFTENAKGRSSRHASMSYHLEAVNGVATTCTAGEDEPPPEDPLMVRPVHFLRANGGSRFSGKMTGLLALLANAADLHHRQFGLFKRQIEVLHHPDGLQASDKVRAFEWRLLEPKSKRSYHFYFLDRERDSANSITDLLRVEIRDSKIAASTSSGGDSDSSDEADLLQRFEIVDMFTKMDPSQLNSLLTPDPLCLPEQPASTPKPQPDADDPDFDADNEDDSEYDDDEDDDWLDDELMDIINEDPDEPADAENDEFEFEPERLLQSVAIPDFFEFLDGASAYSAESQIEVDGKTLLLRETVDLEQQWASLVVGQKQADGDLLNHIDYYINYNSELVFEVEPESGKCINIAKPAPWLRLLSTRHTYMMAAGGGPEATLVEGDKLRLYGVGALWRLASESVYSDFVGLSKEPLLERQGSHFRQAIWTLADDGDLDMQLHFRFLWNQTRWDEDKARKTKRAHRRAPEMLTLDSVYLPEADGDSQAPERASGFPRFKVNLVGGIRRRVSLPLVLPGSCRDLLDGLNKAAEVSRRSFSILAIPSFADYLGTSKFAYFAQYRLTHSLPSPSGREAKPSSVSVVESFDRRLNRGKMTIGQGSDVHQVFIDGARKTIYSYRQRACKKIASLKSLIPILDETSLTSDDTDFSPDALYGLAQLWTRLSKLSKGLATVRQVYDKRGNRQQVRDYTVMHGSSGATSAIRMTFISDPLKSTPTSDLFGDLGRANSDVRFGLRSVDIQPERLWKERHANPLHRTSISVENLVPMSTTPDWVLPDECRFLDPLVPGLIPEKASKLPSIAEILKKQGQLYMRSEVTVSRAFINSDKRLYMLDEWLYRRNVRVKTSGLSPNIDALIYGTTKECFDLSRAYKCPNQLPNIQPYSVDSSDVLDFWADNTSLVENLARVYYAPAALWWMAEKNAANVKLSTAIDILPSPHAATQLGKNTLAREARVESWRVQSPPYMKSSWSYELHFEKKLGMFEEWYALQRIEIEETEWTGMTRRVEIDVIDYNWNEPSREFLDRFLLPEGYNCSRSAEVTSSIRQENDDLGVNLDSDYYANYEASLEVFTPDEKLQFRKDVMPTVTGTFIKGKDYNTFGPYVDISAHYSRVRFSNGTMRSTKRVDDRFRGLVYQIDRLTGFCRIGSDSLSHWTLEIPNDAGVGARNWEVNLELQVLKLLATRTAAQKYLPINRYSSNGQTVSTWELSYPSLRILPYLIGPVTVVRRYENQPLEKYEIRDGGRINTRLHKSIAIKVLVFTPDRSKVRAILNLSFQRIANVVPTEVIRLVNVAQCYNDAASNTVGRNGRSFALDYRLNSGVLWVDEKKAAQNFTLILLQTAKLQPTQFNGVPRASIDFQEETIRIHLNLLEAPTAIEYFKFRPDATMIETMSKASEVKPTGTLRECSAWCDQVNCLSMSFCMDFTCRVLTAPMMAQISTGVVSLEYSATNPLCVYYYKGMVRPWTLDQFASTMDSAVNEELESSKTLLSRLELNFGGIQHKPTRFRQLDSPFGLIEDDEPEEAKGTESHFALKTFRQDHKLELARLEPEDQRVASVHLANTLTECMEHCKATSCLLMSHCRQSGVCLLVSEEAKNLKRLELSAEVTQADSICGVYVRDYLEQYLRFENTNAPRSYGQKLEQHSLVECAAICHNTDTCLSFDVCSDATQDATEENSVCFLQPTHVMTDEFDRAIIEPIKEETVKAGPERFRCDHYSKTALSDYQRIPNRKFDRSDTVGILRGLSVDRCAIDCEQDDDCLAFEHCLDEDHQPAQSCFLIRESGNIQIKDIEKSLSTSAQCDVYIQRHSPEHYNMNSTSHSFISEVIPGLINKHLGAATQFVNIAAYLLIAIVMGSIVQIIYTRGGEYFTKIRQLSG